MERVRWVLQRMRREMGCSKGVLVGRGEGALQGDGCKLPPWLNETEPKEFWSGTPDIVLKRVHPPRVPQTILFKGTKPQIVDY